MHAHAVPVSSITVRPRRLLSSARGLDPCRGRSLCSTDGGEARSWRVDSELRGTSPHTKPFDRHGATFNCPVRPSFSPGRERERARSQAQGPHWTRMRTPFDTRVRQRSPRRLGEEKPPFRTYVLYISTYVPSAQRSREAPGREKERAAAESQGHGGEKSSHDAGGCGAFDGFAKGDVDGDIGVLPLYSYPAGRRYRFRGLGSWVVGRGSMGRWEPGMMGSTSVLTARQLRVGSDGRGEAPRAQP